MTLREFLRQSSPETKQVFWTRLGRAERRDRIYVYSFNDKKKRRKPSPELARAIHAASDGLITLAELRPDIWGAQPAVATKLRRNGNHKPITQARRRRG